MDHDGRDARSPTGRGEPRTLGVQRGLDAIAASAGYPRTWEGWLYLATAIDIASRRVVGWATADHLRTDLVEQALRQAVTRRHPPTGVIFHSDRGCQYTSAQFDCAATELGGRLFPGRKGQCWDNAVGESFFATIKTELLDDGVWPTRRSAETAIFEYIESDYNLHRRHSTLGYLSPAAYEATATAVELVPSTGRGLGRHPRRLERRPRATS